MKAKSEKVPCPNYTWVLFQRDGVYYADGRRHGHGKPSLGTRDRGEALRALADLDSTFSQQLSGSTPHPRGTHKSETTSIKILDGWQRYLDCRDEPVHLGGLKEESKKKYRNYRDSFADFCDKKQIVSWNVVTKKVLQSYGKHIDRQLAPRSVHNNLTMQISVSNWLIMEDLIPDSCKIKWKLKKPSGSDRYCYTGGQVTRMLEMTMAEEKLHWLYETIMLLSYTGLRIGEAVNLKWSDVELLGGVIRVRDESFSNKPVSRRRTLKDGESRNVPIHHQLGEHLKAREGNGYVLRGVKGGQQNVNYAREQFVELVIEPLSSEFPSSNEEIGFADGRFHSFRHFFVSEAFAAGIPESDIRDWVGHSDSKIVELYRHLRIETAKANVQLINFGTGNRSAI